MRKAVEEDEEEGKKGGMMEGGGTDERRIQLPTITQHRSPVSCLSLPHRGQSPVERHIATELLCI